MICPKCGSEMSDDSMFCTKCGAQLGAGAQQSTGATAETAQGNFYTDPQGAQAGNAAGAFQGGPRMNNGMPYGYGNPNGGPQMNGMPYGQPYVDPKDHTAEFDAKDVTENKVVAMLPYLLGAVGIIIAALTAKDSAYVKFHIRQTLKITVLNALLALITAALCWTVIVPIAAAVCIIILLVVRIICFVNVCSGKAKEPAIVSSFGFLK